MNEKSNKHKATVGICILALVLASLAAFLKMQGYDMAWDAVMAIVGWLWLVELVVLYASDEVSDAVVEHGTELVKWLKKEYDELEGHSPRGGNPPFDTNVTANAVSVVLTQLSNENKGIRPVRLLADVKWRMIQKDGYQFMSFSVMRDSSAPLSGEEVRSLCATLQKCISNLLASEYYNLIPFLRYSGDQWDIITVDEVKQSGMDILIDVIWVQDKRVADYLFQKNFGACVGDVVDAPPVDEDFRDD